MSVLQEGQFRPGPDPVFCSPNCSARHSSDLQSRAAENKAGHQVRFNRLVIDRSFNPQTLDPTSPMMQQKWSSG